MKRRLVVLTRFPAPGQAKTRMIPLLGDRGAASLHRMLAERTVLACREACARFGTGIEIRYHGCSARSMRTWLCRDLSFRRQGSGSLGDRILDAFQDGFDDGCDQVVVVGTDCPDLDASVAGRAFEALSRSRVVFGPALDGGYYLVGLSAPAPVLFRDMPWGGCDVLSRSLEAAAGEGLPVTLLDPLGDIDRPADFALVPREIADRIASGKTARDPLISVIIPCGGGPAAPGRAIRSASDPRAEVIVSSSDASQALADLCRSKGTRLVVAGPHRAARLNAGALASRGRVLLFLHEDTVLPLGWADEILRLTAARPRALGAFPLRIGLCKVSIRLIEGLIGFRTRVRRMPYGDQAMFMEKVFFFSRGGFADLPLMEDFEFAAGLASRPLVLAVRPVLTSGRRWVDMGVMRATAVNQLVIAGYHAGVPPSRLREFYGTRKKQAGRVARGGDMQSAAVPSIIAPGDFEGRG